MPMPEGPLWRSTFPDVRVSPALVDGELLGVLEARPAQVVLVDAASGHSLTGGQLADGARRLAAGLRACGAGPGDVLAIIAANSAGYAVVLYGGLAAGMILAQANPALTARELARQFARTRPRFVVVDGRSAPAVRQALASNGQHQAEAVFGLDDPAAAIPFSELLRSGAVPLADRSPDDVAFLFNSSGTSGAPKTAVHTHATATAFLQLFATVPAVLLRPADTVGLTVPISHLYGTAMLSHTLRSGARVVTMTLSPGDLEGYLRTLQDHAVTVAPVTPPLLLALARHPVVDRYDLSSLRLIMSGAAPLPPGVDAEVEERLGCRVVDALGATESWCHAPPADPPVRGSVGRLLPNNQAVIVEPGTGMRLPADQTGELWLRGPQVMREYLGGVAETAATIDADGWLHTGDLCRFDDAGNLYALDRLKELIKVGGYTVAPAEVEGELLAHPAIVDAAVVGRPCADLGEVPVAYVVLAHEADPAIVRAWLAGRLAPWKQVREVIVVEQIPRNPTGKILRRALTEQETPLPLPGESEPPSPGQRTELRAACNSELPEGGREVIAHRAL